MNEGKKIAVAITFYYEIASMDTSGRGGAANQLAELEARTTGQGRGPSYFQQACRIMECGGKLCSKGSDHCWQDEGNHFPLLPHHLRILADHLRAGKPRKGHDDVPHNFRRLVQADDRQREEREQKERDKLPRKRKRRGLDCLSYDTRIINCHCAPFHGSASNTPSTPRMVSPTSPVVELNLPRDEAVRAYNKWQRSQVSDDEQKKHYDKAQELTLTH